MNDLTPNIYQCEAIICQMEELASQQDGELTDAQLQALVEAHTTSLAKLNSLYRFLRFVMGRIDECKREEMRVASARKRAENKLESIERFLLPYVSNYRKTNGHPIDLGIGQLSTRLSSAVEIDDLHFAGEENRKAWCNEKITYTPDKKRIGDALKAGEEIAGAKLVERESLQIR